MKLAVAAGAIVGALMIVLGLTTADDTWSITDRVANIGAAVAAAVAVAATIFGFGRQRFDDFSSEKEDISDQLKALADERSELRDELENKLAQLEPATRFANERKQTAIQSTLFFGMGFVVVAAVVGVGLSEWVNNDNEQSLSTPDAVARIAVIGAAFYLAGQLFRRSSILNIRSQEFQRAAIAMAVTDSLADLMEGDSNEQLRAEFRRSVYEHHLKGTSQPEAVADGSTDSFVTAVEAVNKLRDGGS